VTDGEADQNKERPELKTFTVPFPLGETQGNLTINTKTPYKPSKEQIIKQAFKFHSQGNISEALKYYQNFINQGFSDPEVFSNYGLILRDFGKLKEAELFTRKAIEIKPKFANAYNNLGSILNDLGELNEAEFAIRNAIKIKPDFAEAFSSLGIILKGLNKLEEAELCLRKAIRIKPNLAMAYSNLGMVLYDLKKLKEAELLTRESIQLNPDFAFAHSNLGSILKGLSRFEEAELSIRNAIRIKPDYAEAFWNLYTVSNSLEEAKERIKKCLQINEKHLKAKLTLSALNLYQGDDSSFNDLLKSKHMDHPYMRSFKWIFDLKENPKLLFRRWSFFDSMIKKSNKDRPFYEFGVWQGVSFKYLIKTFKKGYGFDTFEGLPEDWHNNKKGAYSAERIIPNIDGGTFIEGKFEYTLSTFFAKPRPMASIINFDADLYSSTICALNHSKSVIDEHTILIFDEFIMNKHWEQDEYKALNEFCSSNNLSYQVIAFSYITGQVAVKLIGL